MKFVERKEQAVGLLQEATEAIKKDDFEAAEVFLEQAHRWGHDMALVHFRVHYLLLRIGWLSKRPVVLVSQILPLIFAIPVSWVQHYLGLALPNRRT